MTDYDVIVLGGGSAGTSAARAASRAGARTAVVNDGELGGLCILRGCMPTKAMLVSAHAAHEAENAEPLGVRVEGHVVPDFSRIMSRKDALVGRFQRAKIDAVRQQEYEVLPGRASFAEGGGVEVDGHRLAAHRYVIATGSRPWIPAIPGIDDTPVLTSDDVMKLTSPPPSVIVHGAGAIGLELTQFFARIGSEVLLVCRSPVTHAYDPEAGEELIRALIGEPRIEHAIPATIRSVRKDGDGVAVRIFDKGRERERTAAALIMATGREADLENLEIHHAGVELRDGRIEHDAAMRTSNPTVFVAGDATGSHQILHLANQEGDVAGHNAAGGSPERTMDYRLKMAVVFTEPTFAHVGMTAVEMEEAERTGRQFAVARARFPETGRAITMGAQHGLWKLFVDRATCEIVGSSIVGPRADDLIHLISTMMFYGASGRDIARMPWYHPTLSEVMMNLERDLARQISDCEAAPPPPA